MELKTSSKTFRDIETVYCPGCFHGLINRIICQVIDEMKIREETIGVNSQGCGSFAPDYINLDFVEAPPGLAPSVARGIKYVFPDKMLFTYQGDGDLLSYGIGDLIHAASKGEKITVILVNNLVMAQSGGQMSPTTLVGQITETTPYGRSVERSGREMKIAEIIAKLPGSAYVSRVTVDTPERIKNAKQALTEAFTFQREGKGFSFVEFLSLCPTYWNKSPKESRTWLQETLVYQYPIGLIKRTQVK